MRFSPEPSFALNSKTIRARPACRGTALAVPYDAPQIYHRKLRERPAFSLSPQKSVAASLFGRHCYDIFCFTRGLSTYAEAFVVMERACCRISIATRGTLM